MSIRRILTLILIVTSCFAVAGAIALVALTTALRGAADDLRSSVEGVHLSEEARVDLLRWVRRSDLAVLSSGDTEVDRATIEHELHGRLADLQRTARDDGERRLATEAADLVTKYLAARRGAESRFDELADVIRSTTPELEAALRVLGQLTAMNVADAERATGNAARWDQWSNVIGAAVVAILLGLVPAAVWWLGARVLRPLIAISRAVERYAAGVEDTRVPPMRAVELEQIGRSFNALADSLRQQRDQQATSIAAIAHDLRTPLNALRLAVHVADADPAPPVARTAFDIVRRQSERLERMVSDLLDSAYIEAGQMELRLEPCDLRTPLSNAVELYVAAAPAHRLHLSAPSSPVIMTCDRLRIEQVVTNLLSNAIKYSAAGSNVDVELRVERDRYILTVADEGIGIPEAAVAHLFQPFHRVKGRREDIPGTGLGLSVSRRIVEAHGGYIDVYSVEGRGSIFRVSLPAGTVDFNSVLGPDGRSRRLHASGDR
ncbi:MAG TPA: HAMP domain-containing sensor histidine kinase [Vicinamibacterales bacterium]|nr:HAMP domain-containing sensor histidine kinase [Vicinamibacterales bacterium]